MRHFLAILVLPTHVLILSKLFLNKFVYNIKRFIFEPIKNGITMKNTITYCSSITAIPFGCCVFVMPSMSMTMQ